MALDHKTMAAARGMAREVAGARTTVTECDAATIQFYCHLKLVESLDSIYEQLRDMEKRMDSPRG